MCISYSNIKVASLIGYGLKNITKTNILGGIINSTTSLWTKQLAPILGLYSFVQNHFYEGKDFLESSTNAFAVTANSMISGYAFHVGATAGLWLFSGNPFIVAAAAAGIGGFLTYKAASEIIGPHTKFIAERANEGIKKLGSNIIESTKGYANLSR